MNITILAIGLFAIFAFVVPMVIINNHGKALIAKRKKQIEDIAQRNNIVIDHSEVFKTMILAIDKQNKKFVHIENDKERIIDLLSATSVRIDKEYINKSKVLDKITLVITTKNDTVNIPFYSSAQKNLLDLQEQNSSSIEWLHLIEDCSLKQKESQSSVA